MAATECQRILSLIGSAFLPRPGNDFQWTNGRLVGGQVLCVRVCVCFMFGFQIWSPCKRILSPSSPDVKNKQILVKKKWKHFTCPIRVLKSGISKIWKKWQNSEDVKVLAFFRLCNSTFKYPYRPWNLLTLFPPKRSHIDLHSNRRKNGKSLNPLHGL